MGPPSASIKRQINISSAGSREHYGCIEIGNVDSRNRALHSAPIPAALFRPCARTVRPDIATGISLRNIVAHHNGLVHIESKNKVKPYGYKVGDSIHITEADFHESVSLVNDACSAIAEQYGHVLKNQRKKGKKI